ncbi:MAG: dTDP-4-amino-4,6-dideoxygalactose transaminase [Proteobacteria bacterium]|nr:dTDP-4-amino-4,6-dideoxygalactose transaminase [Pseudomonadota bacterium]
MSDRPVPFNRPYMTGRELEFITQAHERGALAGDGPFTARCHEWLERLTDSPRALLTHSCTAALEMAALLLDIQPGDEIIMPSFTFVSTANAFVLRGGIPVFVDIREDTLNIDEQLIEAAITSRTRAVCVVHYAGVACEMDEIQSICQRYELALVEDAAQGLMSLYKGRALGAIGDYGAYSFHETKNIISGEGGALMVNSPYDVQMAEIIREKGTDRSAFYRGEIDKYTWQAPGSSFLPGEIIAAFLWAQFEDADDINEKRLLSWRIYDRLLEQMEQQGRLRRPVIPVECDHNAHLYYGILPAEVDRGVVLSYLKEQQIHCLFHYVPLHDSPAGKKYARTHGDLVVTESMASRLLRLPLWVGITSDDQERVVATLDRAIDLGRP